MSEEDTKVLFTLLKSREYVLSNAERQLLLKTEKALYTRLSVDEVEALLPPSRGGTAGPVSGGKGGL